MTLELEVGKQYKTRGGWRCVVVEIYKDENPEFVRNFIVWHSNIKYNEYHRVDGLICETEKNDYDIISEWQEPKTHTVWVALYRDSSVFGVNTVCYPVKPIKTKGMVALIKRPITEGEFDDE